MTPREPTNIGDMLRRWRSADHLGVRGAAKQIGISYSTLNRIERGYPMDVATFMTILVWAMSPRGGQ
jgi:transcriptional regulator with XRE-family HTH domain